MFGKSGHRVRIGTQALLLCVITLLTACGGGGGGGSGGNKSSTPTLTANAGADITVNMGSRVTLDPKVLVANATGYSLTANGVELTGSSTVDQQIVKLVWQKMEGPDFAVSSSSYNDGIIYFTAPATASTATIVFKLTLTNAAGMTASDSITITVKRVNQLPTADGGSTQEVKAGTLVTLDGSASKDSDGSIAKYTWQQKSGTQVTLNNQNTAKASFTAPVVSANTDLQFELKVEDNEGATATQTVTIKVTPANVPEVAIFFPPAAGAYGGTSISAYGSAKVADGQITSITLTLGGTPITATLKEDGSWSADNLTVPAGTSATLTATATDNLGRSGQASATLYKSGTIGSGPGIGDVIGFAVDSTLNKLLVLTSSDDAGTTRLLSIDMANGKRSANISSFSDSNQGPTNEALIEMTYDPASKKAYVTGAPADLTISPYVISIDTTTGQRSLVASNTKGTGATLDYPYGVAFTKGSLYVADIFTDKILKIDPATGNRTTIADENSDFYMIASPALLAVDQRSADPLLYMMPYATNGFVLGLTTDTNSSLTDLITDSSIAADGPVMKDMPRSLVADEELHKLYVLTDDSAIIEVDTWTGKRKTLRESEPALGPDKIAYDPVKRVLYVINDFPLSVSAVNPATGQSVQINQAF